MFLYIYFAILVCSLIFNFVCMQYNTECFPFSIASINIFFPFHFPFHFLQLKDDSSIFKFLQHKSMWLVCIWHNDFYTLINHDRIEATNAPSPWIKWTHLVVLNQTKECIYFVYIFQKFIFYPIILNIISWKCIKRLKIQ